MKKINATIDVWQFIPPAVDERGLAYRISGRVDDKPYCGEILIEINGHDAEYKSFWGVDLAPKGFCGEEWDAILVAMSTIWDLPVVFLSKIGRDS